MSTEPNPEAAAVSPELARQRALLRGAGGLLLLVLAAYWPALNGKFVWDDPLLTEKNPLVTGEFTLASIWFKMDFPVATIACWLQWWLWGKSAAGYHIVNILLHAGNCVLLWRLFARLQLPGAWLAAALFAVHPIGAASVAWISELKNVLSLLFLLLSFWTFVAWDEARGAAAPVRPRGAYALSLVLFLLALLTKTSTVALPVLLLGYLWWRWQRLSRTAVFATVPHFILALAFGLLTVWFQKHQVVLGLTVQEENLFGRVAGAAWAVWFYLGKATLPVNLCAVYPLWKVNPANLAHWLPLLGLVAVGGGCWWFRKSWGRTALLLGGGFVALLFPVLGFFDMYFLIFSRVSDHFAYLALIPATLGLALVLNRLLPQRFLRVAAAVILAGFAVLTFQRAAVYAVDEKLWSDTVAKNPAAWNALNNLGCIRAEQGQMDAAMELFLRSVKLNPRNASAQCNLGKALLLRGSFAEAEAHFRTALEAKPDHGDTLKAFGGALAQQGRLKEAVKYLGDAVTLKPDNETRLQLAPLLAAVGNSRAAVAQCRAVLAKEPQSFRALNNLAWILATCPDAAVRNGSEAVKLAETACQLTGRKDAITLGTLGAAYAEAGQFTNAIAAAEQAVALAGASGNTGFARANQQLLQFYRAGRAYHEPAPKQ